MVSTISWNDIVVHVALNYNEAMKQVSIVFALASTSMNNSVTFVCPLRALLHEVLTAQMLANIGLDLLYKLEPQVQFESSPYKAFDSGVHLLAEIVKIYMIAFQRLPDDKRTDYENHTEKSLGDIHQRLHDITQKWLRSILSYTSDYKLDKWELEASIVNKAKCFFCSRGQLNHCHQVFSICHNLF
jgi:hypothetical protein